MLAFVAQETTIPHPVAARSGAPSAGMAIRWVFPLGDGSITKVELGTTSFGRDPECTGYLPSGSVSRRHAEIRYTPRNVPMLHDAGSKNGVFLNGRAVAQAPLRIRDVVRLGDWIGILVLLPADGSATWTFEEVTKGYWAGPSLLGRLAPARLVARSDLSIIIQGETGSGKEGAARAIHEWSGRNGPFLAVNCAALPEALAEGELFGYRKGAFTGAERPNPGFLRAAQGGTLFLDEIADLSLSIQAKLLRAVEQREVIPLGESKPVSVDVRLVAAAQGALRKAVDEKRFRGDLLARLDGLTVVLPPLRERAEEVPFLLSKIIEQHRGESAPPRFEPGLIESLCVYDWPFNVRELTQLVRQLLVLHPDAAVLTHDMLPERVRFVPTSKNPGATSEAASDETHPMDEEARSLLAALRTNGGNVKQASETIGISRGRAYRLLEKIDAPELAGFRRDVSPGSRER